MEENTNLQSSAVNAQSQGDITQSAEFKVPNPKNKFKIIFMIFLFIILIIGGYIFFENRQLFFQDVKRCQAIARICKDGTMGKPGTAACSQVCPEDSLPPTITQKPIIDETASPDSIGANWKTYTNEKFTFRYPSNYFVKESVKDFIVILADENMPAQNAEISIDARLVETYDNYDKAVVATKENLQEAEMEVIDNGIKISGKGKTGPSLGTQFTVALIKYKQGVIAIEITTTDSGKLQMFDQILSTFRFAN